MTDLVTDGDAILMQFNRLMLELLRGQMNRNSFRPWEVEILLDIQACDFQNESRRDILRRYQKAVQKQMENGAATPMKVSEYLAGLRAKRLAKEESADPSTVS
jgi:hypothetical protein